VTFLGPGWAKIGGKNWHDLRAFDDGYTRCNSALFWQTERLLSIFSTGREKNGFTGFSGIGPDTVGGKGARIGLILPEGNFPSILRFSDKKKERSDSPPCYHPNNLLSCRRVRNSKKYHKMFRKYCIR
jgi:hypothetical protein